MVELISGGPVTCTSDKRDLYKRLIGICYVGEGDLNAALVRAGQAFASICKGDCPAVACPSVAFRQPRTTSLLSADQELW